MANSILNLLNSRKAKPVNQSISQVAEIKNMMQKINSTGNPSAYIQQLANTNPQVRQVMQYIQSNGGDAKTAAFNYASQNGIDINSLLSVLNK